MKVILQQTVLKVGKAGDVVEASPGYFRNFLQPRKLAVLATAGTLKKREEDLETLRKKAQAAYQAALEMSEKINQLGRIYLNMKAGEGGKLYGKVTTKEIAQTLQKELGFEIDKRAIKTNEDISALGTYKVFVKLAADVQSELSIDVLPEGAVPSASPVVKDTSEIAEKDGELAIAEGAIGENQAPTKRARTKRSAAKSGEDKGLADENATDEEPQSDS